MDAQSLRSKASEETLVSLLQLDPSPIDTTQANTEKDLPPLPEESLEASAASVKSKTGSIDTTATNTSSLGLSGQSHGPIYYLTRIQRYSTYLFPIFTGLHFANTSLIPLLTRSVPASESYLLLAREIYQTPLTEPLLVGLPVLAHVAAGVSIRLVRRSQNKARYGAATPATYALLHPRKRAADADADADVARPRHASALSHWPHLSTTSAAGYAFAGALGAHVFMNRALPLAVEGDSANIGLGYVAHGFARHAPLASAAYAVLLAAGCGHMVWGAARWLGWAQVASAHPPVTGNKALDQQRKRRRRRARWAIHGVATALALAWAAGGLGVVARAGASDGWVGKIYDGLYEKLPLL